MRIETAAKKLALVPTTRLAAFESFAPIYRPMRTVADAVSPNDAPTSRKNTVLAFAVAVSAASPRKRPIQIEFTEALSDARTLLSRPGTAKLSKQWLIDP